MFPIARAVGRAVGTGLRRVGAAIVQGAQAGFPRLRAIAGIALTATSAGLAGYGLTGPAAIVDGANTIVQGDIGGGVDQIVQGSSGADFTNVGNVNGNFALQGGPGPFGNGGFAANTGTQQAGDALNATSAGLANNGLTRPANIVNGANTIVQGNINGGVDQIVQSSIGGGGF